MRLHEFNHGPTNTPESNLLTALELIQHRYKDIPTPPKISTKSLINLVLNTDRTFDYDALVNAVETNPAVKNLIKNYNADYVELRSADESSEDEATTTVTPDGETTDASVDTVSNMATRAAKKRDADIF